MRPYSAYDSDTCSIARTLALIGDRWTLLVLRDVVNGVGRFDELAGHLGIARNILSGRLARLEQAGLVERTAYREPGARERHAYRLTGPGRELVPILLAFMAWGDRHLAGPEGPPGRGPPRRLRRADQGLADLRGRPRARAAPAARGGAGPGQQGAAAGR